MSKYIPTNNKPKGQVKPKLKVKVVFNEEEKILNEYDAFAMISDLNGRISQHEKLLQELAQGFNGIMDGMKAGASAVQQTSAPVQGKLSLPKLKTETSTLDAPKNIYPNSADEVKLES